MDQEQIGQKPKGIMINRVKNLSKSYRNALRHIDPKIGSQAPLDLPILHQQNTARSSGIGKVEKYPKRVESDGFFKEVEIYA